MRVRVFDKAKYHFGGRWPTDLPVEQAYVHAGLFLAWLTYRDLLNPSFAARQSSAIDAVRNRRLTGPQFFRAIDGVLGSSMLSREGEAFTSEYFDLRSGPFIDEYERLLAAELPTIYHVPDTWESYDVLAKHLDSRLAEWRAKRDA